MLGERSPGIQWIGGAGWAPEPFWTFCRKDRSLPLPQFDLQIVQPGHFAGYAIMSPPNSYKENGEQLDIQI
jgi:hypothetical protein